MARASRFLATPLAVWLALLAACATKPPAVPGVNGPVDASVKAADHAGTVAAASDTVARAARAPADPSFDWRRLPLAPLGTPFKSVNAVVHEVLLFRDTSTQSDPDSDARDDAEHVEARDCYAPNDTAPRFIGRPTEAYLVCFHDDRLNRAQAVVRFDAVDEEPAKLFATLCTNWLASGEPELQSATRCAGHDGERAFSAEFAPGTGTEPSALRIVVYDVSAR